MGPMLRKKSQRHPYSHCWEYNKNTELQNHKVYAEDLPSSDWNSVCFGHLCEFLWALFSKFCRLYFHGVLISSNSYSLSFLLWSSPGSASSFAVGLCICSHPLLDEASLMTTELSTDIWVWQSIIKNHFIYFFFLNLVLSSVSELSCLWFLTRGECYGMVFLYAVN